VQTHTVQITGPSLGDIRALLDVTEMAVGVDEELVEGTSLRPTSIEKSSGFAETVLVVNAVVTVLTGTSTAVLTGWLQDRLRGKGGSTVTVVVDGKVLEAAPHDGPS
jgi:hypothetical protein